MDYVSMGNSGLKVSRACLGTMNFGTHTGLAATGEPEAKQIISGPPTHEQLEQNLAGIGLRLPDDDIAHLTQISQPADGGRA